MIIKYHPGSVYRPEDFQNKVRREVKQDKKLYYLPRKMKYPALEFLKRVPILGYIMKLALIQVDFTCKVFGYFNKKVYLKLLSKEN